MTIELGISQRIPAPPGWTMITVWAEPAGGTDGRPFQVRPVLWWSATTLGEVLAVTPEGEDVAEIVDNHFGPEGRQTLAALRDPSGTVWLTVANICGRLAGASAQLSDAEASALMREKLRNMNAHIQAKTVARG